LHDLHCALGACGGVLRQQTHHDVRECRRNIRAAIRQRRRRLGEMRRGDRASRPTAERVSAGEHLVRDDAERVEVRAMIRRRVAHGLLGRHVRRRPHRDAGGGEIRVRRRRVLCGGGERLGDTEVGDHSVPARQQHVLRLEVPVHDTPAVRVPERVGQLAHQAHRVRQRERAIAR
jgi:hypothetical protein